ncbi:MAG: ABC transporter ATP-binding protein [Planctomycetota bacterium]|nr:MAG: ABC transporter ATP-binding protein [Planctomycetota bacterium]REJ95895.1 MAG: ABC transporter ATP-binding protein [Planctomycetota bacterium]REK25283.1 MAG: ABC transporter ATP-binding protein [Planctomycetota bacterium]REK37987.1 MAG: ABC transporter ATP-binding protein [Planctomycetota bacterium]
MIQVRHLSVTLGQFSLRDVSFEIERGEYAVLMGKTGTGKTTLLECLCGLRPIEAGQIVIDEVDVTKLKPAERGIGYVPQDGALFTSMTVAAQIAFPLEIREWARHDIATRIEELAELLGIGNLLDRRPEGLSGGEAQRVALGRALAHRPPILFLDEPLSALDEETRVQMYELLARVREYQPVTALHVTHNRSEARRLADRVLRYVDGQIVEIDREELALLPADEEESPV